MFLHQCFFTDDWRQEELYLSPEYFCCCLLIPFSLRQNNCQFQFNNITSGSRVTVSPKINGVILRIAFQVLLLFWQLLPKWRKFVTSWYFNNQATQRLRSQPVLEGALFSQKNHVRRLEVLWLEARISLVVLWSFYQFWLIRHLWWLRKKCNLAAVICALITSRLNYCALSGDCLWKQSGNFDWFLTEGPVYFQGLGTGLISLLC